MKFTTIRPGHLLSELAASVAAEGEGPIMPEDRVTAAVAAPLVLMNPRLEIFIAPSLVKVIR